MSTFEYAVSVIISSSVIVLFISIFIDFYLYQGEKNTKLSKHSIVATGSMFAFYFVYYIILQSGIGKWYGIPFEMLKIQVITGVLMVVFGTVINILGRFQLKSNWANHIKIYKNHSLITHGVYSYVRHPLYSSIILMLFGGSLVYSNWVSAVLVSLVFIPAMAYRAKQEEQLLLTVFPEYMEYQQQVGLFLPKHLRGYKK